MGLEDKLDVNLRQVVQTRLHLLDLLHHQVSELVERHLASLEGLVVLLVFALGRLRELHLVEERPNHAPQDDFPKLCGLFIAMLLEQLKESVDTRLLHLVSIIAVKYGQGRKDRNPDF